MKRFFYILFIIISCVTSCQQSVKQIVTLNSQPDIWPDYNSVTIPAEIAPMNFNFIGGAYNYLTLKIKGSKSGSLETSGKFIDIDIDEWHSLTEANKGGYLECYLSTTTKGIQTDYLPFKMYVSDVSLSEYGLTYRKVAPGYVSYSKMGIYCRNLSNFQEDIIFENTAVLNTCVNCHTSNKTDPKDFVFHIRGKEHGGTVIQHNGNHKIFDTKTSQTLGSAVYPYWHKNGRYVAFSTNKTLQVFHTANPKRIEVFDTNSDLQIYDVDHQEFVLSDEIKNDSIMETFPSFSSDGNELYYCATPKMQGTHYLEEIKYAIMRIKFDENTGKTIGTKDTLIYHPNQSSTLPRPSYDGKYLMYTVSNYGTFPIWHKEADLYLYSFADSTTRPISEVNSEYSDSFHNWSDNSRWFVFTSRREDGLFTRLYISSIDENGHCTKPFLLPQKNPLLYYNNLFLSYNTPDFTKEKVDVSLSTLRNEIQSDLRETIGTRK